MAYDLTRPTLKRVKSPAMPSNAGPGPRRPVGMGVMAHPNGRPLDHPLSPRRGRSLPPPPLPFPPRRGR